MMALGFSLHVGVDMVGPMGPGSQSLHGCKNDAQAMADIAKSHGFDEPKFLLDNKATLQTVIDTLKHFATEVVKSEDIFLFTFAGHGSFIGDEDLDELDHRDETLVLFDLMLSDDVLRREVWPLFPPNARIVMVADSCDSGSVNSLADAVGITEGEQLIKGNFEISRTTDISEIVSGPRRVRGVSDSARLGHIAANKDRYEMMFRALPVPGPDIHASVLLLAACPDSSETADGDPHGVFTQALLDVLDASSPLTDYNDLLQKVCQNLAPQTPVLSVIPQPNAAFLAQRPFSII